VTGHVASIAAFAAQVVPATADAISPVAVRAVMIGEAARYAHRHGEFRATDVRAHGRAISRDRGRGCVTFRSGSTRVRINGDVFRVDGRYRFANGLTIQVKRNRKDAC
jgi:hypothetical protein